MKPRIMFLVRSLNIGGAERQLVTLLKELASRGHDVSLAVMYSGGPLEVELASSRVRILPLGKTHRWDLATFVFRLWRMARNERPDIVHGYLPTPNLSCLALKLFRPKVRIVWGIRDSGVRREQSDWLAGLATRIQGITSGWVDGIISNSNAGRRNAIANGLPGERITVIPNGIDTDKFRPSPADRADVRAELGFAPDEQVVAMLGRLDPMKDHATFLRAAASAALADPFVRFLCAGDGPPAYLGAMQSLAAELGLGRRILWIPARPDSARLLNAIDVLTLSSAYGEGFPNVLAEAMACGKRCVATDVGDSRMIVAGFGEVIPPGDPAALSRALRSTLDCDWNPELTRQSIVERFAVARLADLSEQALWLKTLQQISA